VGLGSIFKSVAKVAGPVVGGLIGGPAGSAIGSALSGWAAGSEANDQTNAINNKAEQLSDRQMGFQRDMSNTAYQRAMRDMRKAGLNPILSYKMGGASTPQGAQPRLYNPADSVTTGYQAMQAASNVGLQSSQQDKIGAEIDKLAADTGLSKQQAELVKAQLPKVAEEIEKIKADAGFRRAMTTIPQAVTDMVNAIRSIGDIGDGAALERGLRDMLNITIKKDASDYPDKPWFDWSWSKERTQ